MTEVTPQSTPKKGLSKGCLIGLVVGGVVLVMLIVAIVVIYIYREDIAKASGSIFVNQVQTMAAEDPAPGLDTVQFNAVCDGLKERMEAEPLEAEKFAVMMKQIQTIPADSKVDSIEVEIFYEAVFEMYPDLEELAPPLQMDEMDVEDTGEMTE